MYRLVSVCTNAVLLSSFSWQNSTHIGYTNLPTMINKIRTHGQRGGALMNKVRSPRSRGGALAINKDLGKIFRGFGERRPPPTPRAQRCSRHFFGICMYFCIEKLTRSMSPMQDKCFGPRPLVSPDIGLVMEMGW